LSNHDFGVERHSRAGGNPVLNALDSRLRENDEPLSLALTVHYWPLIRCFILLQSSFDSGFDVTGDDTGRVSAQHSRRCHRPLRGICSDQQSGGLDRKSPSKRVLNLNAVQLHGVFKIKNDDSKSTFETAKLLVLTELNNTLREDPGESVDPAPFLSEGFRHQPAATVLKFVFSGLGKPIERISNGRASSY
jgi:hypothetical protein